MEHVVNYVNEKKYRITIHRVINRARRHKELLLLFELHRVNRQNKTQYYTKREEMSVIEQIISIKDNSILFNRNYNLQIEFRRQIKSKRIIKIKICYFV